MKNLQRDFLPHSPKKEKMENRKFVNSKKEEKIKKEGRRKENL